MIGRNLFFQVDVHEEIGLTVGLASHDKPFARKGDAVF